MRREATKGAATAEDYSRRVEIGDEGEAVGRSKIEALPALDLERHVVGVLRGAEPGPTLVAVGGIHGNEPAGVRAMRRVLPSLRLKAGRLRGEVVLLAGNTRALERGARYTDADLNRQWTRANLAAVRRGRLPTGAGAEAVELAELLTCFERAAARARGEIYFVDLHTTSAHGVPFATVGDTLRNRAFALNFPATIVLGLEEQIEGTMLEHVNNTGAVTMGFEAGQHEADSSVDNHEAVLWIALVASGALRAEDAPEFAAARETLGRASGGARVVEVRHRRAIRPEDEFRMGPGFANFDPVRKGQTLALDRGGLITARETGLILLPLYQKLGDDGFFLGREVRPFWLKLSALLRRLRVGTCVHLLPGVSRSREDADTFVVNTRVARLLPLQVFHLLGFRKRRWEGNRLVVSRRKYDLAGPQGKG
jgi:predicted deacylase